MKFYIADAFAKDLFCGNPAGVVILDKDSDFPADEVMRQTAAELRYSETAFIKPLSDDTFNIRYFTPAAEVDLCGHATIAAFCCLKDAGYISAGDTCINITAAGELHISIGDDNVFMDMAKPEYCGEISEPDKLEELYSIMGLSADGVKPHGMLPQIISTGLPDIIMPVATRDDLEAISPDFPALSRLSEKYSVTGVHAFTLEGGTLDCSCASDTVCGTGNMGSGTAAAFCRNFAPLYDIDEEAATGTANGALTFYLIKNKLIEPGETSFIQGEAMNRPSRISSVSALDGDEVSIRIGGSAAILAKGTINI